MSDGSVRPFPRSSRDRVVLAPPLLHYLLPTLRSYMVHLTVLDFISISKDELFKDRLYISNCTTSFLNDMIRHVLPENWNRCMAVLWGNSQPAHISTSTSSTTINNGSNEGNVVSTGRKFNARTDVRTGVSTGSQTTTGRQMWD